MGSAVDTKNCRPLLRSGETNVRSERRVAEDRVKSQGLSDEEANMAAFEENAPDLGPCRKKLMGSAVDTKNCRPLLRSGETSVRSERRVTELASFRASDQRAPKGKRLPKRSRRLTSIFTRGRPIFFVTICTARRMNILTNSEVHKQFVTYCLRSPELAQIWVGRYVLMPDHLHVFVSVEDSESLSRWVGSLKKYLSYFWRSTGLVGPFWQQSFFDHLLRNKESYTEKWTYVVQNPVRAGLAEYASDWPYSGEIHEQWWDEV